MKPKNDDSHATVQTANTEIYERQRRDRRVTSALQIAEHKMPTAQQFQAHGMYRAQNPPANYQQLHTITLDYNQQQ